jgi:soluble epoxide hydrolase / lipid-phosphate phosphatase
VGGAYQFVRQLTLQLAQNLPAQPQQIPWLLIYGTKDKTCDHRAVDNTTRFIPQIKIVKLEGKSHWVMIEARFEVTQMILDFVKDNLEVFETKL